MAKMVNPELETVRFENEDVIATSYIMILNGKWWRDGQERSSTTINAELYDYSWKRESSDAEAYGDQNIYWYHETGNQYRRRQ